MGKPTFFRNQYLVEMLEGLRRGMTIEDLRERLGVSRKTVTRYLAALEEEGWVEEAGWTEDEKYPQKLWRLTHAAREKRVPLKVGLTEFFALQVAHRAAMPTVENTELGPALRSLVSKMTVALKPETRRFTEAMLSVVGPAAGPQRLGHPGPWVVEDVFQAVAERKVLEAEYRPVHLGGRKTRKYRLKPLTIFQAQGGLYVAAMAGDHEAPARFALDRFESVEVTDEVFELPRGFSPESLVAQGFGVFDGDPIDIRVRFSAEVAPVVRERRWHPTQTVADNPDGTIDIRFRAGGWPEIRAWVLRYGRHAELIEPAERRVEIEEELTGALDCYERDSR
ncbi:MAG: WYL domain-containing transcriptional regulator [Deltaproteobacteria bacterium]|nr:WYL domain-containing transcriptional regulator [Deltaproteobacteria bacterium]